MILCVIKKCKKGGGWVYFRSVFNGI